MADFKPGTQVVVREMPSLLGKGWVIDTPSYSTERLTWAQFKGGTIAAFEPGELQLLTEWLKTLSSPSAMRHREANESKGAR